ncbi:MAG: FKBP-type peptidyl-prolyl cis-trans isomerase [Myxococcales bacterium]|nr:FKBP-type peptidyl-prolyl cis-trans isomerase [Myxococcales bacterium]
MDRTQLSWALTALAAGVGLVALVLVLRGPSPAEVPPAQPFEIPDLPSYVKNDAPARPLPVKPQTAPEGALIEQASGLEIWDIAPGEGLPPVEGQVVAIDYAGWTENGVLVDTSFRGTDPLRFAVGSGRALKGLDEGVRQMRPGGRRQLVIPAELAFGAKGIPGKVPPSASLIYEITLVDVLRVPDSPTPVPAELWQQRPKGLRVADLVTGAGTAVKPGRSALLDFTMWANGERIDSTLDDPRPVLYEAGAKQLFEGWELGMAGMKAGGHRVIVVPPELGFGAEGRGEPGEPKVIPSDATLTLEVLLRRVD